MKRYILAAALFLVSLYFADTLSAGNFGVTGGANFRTYNLKDVGSKTLTQRKVAFIY